MTTTIGSNLSPQNRPAEPTGSRAFENLAIAGLPVAAIALRVWNPTSRANAGPTLCPFRICTGEACPGCGMTRGLGALVNGEWTESFRLHPLATLVALQSFALWVMALSVRSNRLDRDQIRRVAVPLAIVNTALFFGVWVARWRLGLLDYVL